MANTHRKPSSETTIACSRHHSFHDRMSDSSDFHAELRMRKGAGIGFFLTRSKPSHARLDSFTSKLVKALQGAINKLPPPNENPGLRPNSDHQSLELRHASPHSSAFSNSFALRVSDEIFRTKVASLESIPLCGMTDSTVNRSN